MAKYDYALFILLILWAWPVAALQVSLWVEQKANEYKGYDELITNITYVEYQNKTYYWVDYSRMLVYSGSLLIGPDCKAAEDGPTLELFITADMIHKNYPPESVGQWKEFSRYFDFFSVAYRSSHPELSKDARNIAVSLNGSADALQCAIASYSPQATEEYLRSQDMLIEQMEAAYINSMNSSEESPGYLGEYKDALLNIGKTIKESRQGLTNAAGYMAGNMHLRVASEKNRPLFEIIMAGASGAVILFVLLIRLFKR